MSRHGTGSFAPGLPLRDRRGRSLVLNPAGAALLRAVEPALDGLAGGVLAAQAAARGQAQQLRLTVLPSFAQRWLLPRMGRHEAIAAEPLLGPTDLWGSFLALSGCRLSGNSVADFNDAGLMLQAAEGDLGIALARELLAADALQAARLVRVSPLALRTPQQGTSSTYWFVYPPELTDWPPLCRVAAVAGRRDGAVARSAGAGRRRGARAAWSSRSRSATIGL